MTSKKPKALSNHEIVTLAVYLLGGDSKRIDTEDVAVKANELAPGRFTWRKYRDQISIDAVRKRLWDASRAQKGGYLFGSERDGWSLTPAGVTFANTKRDVLAKANLTRTPLNSKESADPPLEHANILADTEKTFVAVFREIGPLVELHKLEKECMKQGMNQTTFGINLSNSPIISRFARCVYGLRGTEVPPGLAESVVVERRKTRVLSDYGWTQDGKIFLAYMLSSGTISNGIVSVPSGMKQHLFGAYELRVAGGVPIGRLVVKDSQAWGLGPLFRRRGGDPGDSLRILFDLKTKTAVAELGQSSVEEEDEVNQQLVK